MHIHVCLDIFYCRIPRKNRLPGPLKRPSVLFGSPQKGVSPVSITLLVVPPHSNFCVPSPMLLVYLLFTEAWRNSQKPNTKVQVMGAMSSKLPVLGWQSWDSEFQAGMGKRSSVHHVLTTLCHQGPKAALLRPRDSTRLFWMVPSISAARSLKFSLGIKWEGRCSSCFIAPFPFFLALSTLTKKNLFLLVLCLQRVYINL